MSRPPAQGPGDPAEGHEIGSAYLPDVSRGDFAGMLAGVFGTILTAILAGAVAVDKGEVAGRAAAAILIAIGDRAGQHGACRRPDR